MPGPGWRPHNKLTMYEAWRKHLTQELGLLVQSGDRPEPLASAQQVQALVCLLRSPEPPRDALDTAEAATAAASCLLWASALGLLELGWHNDLPHGREARPIAGALLPPLGRRPTREDAGACYRSFQRSYELVLQVTERLRKWEVALQLLLWMNTRRFNPGVAGRLATGWRLEERGGSSQKPLTQSHRTQSLQSSALRRIQSNGISEEELLADVDLIVKGGPVPEKVLGLSLTALGDKSLWHRALEMLRELAHETLELSLLLFNNAIAAVQLGGSWQGALQLLVKMRHKGVQPDSVGVCAAIDACATSALWRVTLEVLARFDTNVNGFTAAISAVRNARQWPWSLHLLQHLVQEGLSPDEVACSAAISSCEKALRWPVSLQLLRNMGRALNKEGSLEERVAAAAQEWAGALRGSCTPVDLPARFPIEPGVASYTAAMSSCWKGGRWDLALELLEEMVHRELTPNAVALSTAVAACESGGLWQRALSLLRKSSGTRRDAQLYNSVIGACGSSSAWEHALALLQELSIGGKAGLGILQPTVVSYNLCLQALGTAKEGRFVPALLVALRERRLEPDEISYNLAIKSCAVSGLWKAAQELLLDMRSQSLEPFFHSVLAGLAAGAYADELWPKSLELLLSVRRAGKLHDDAQHRATMAALAARSAWEFGLELLKDLSLRGPKPTPAAKSAVQEGRLRAAGPM